MRYFVDEEGGVEMARDGVRGKKSTDLVVYVINEATKLLKGTSVFVGNSRGLRAGFTTQAPH